MSASTADTRDCDTSHVVMVRRRGVSKAPNWRRPERVAVMVLDLDVSGDAVMRRRLEAHWSAVFRLRRALQRDVANACRAYLAAVHERAAVGGQVVRGRLGLSRARVEARAAAHVEAAGWLRHHLTKATGLHVAGQVWQACDRFLFPDAAGRRHGLPRVGDWWRFAQIPGRARSHTKSRPVWETYRLVGSLQGHLDAYGRGLTVADAAQAVGRSVFAQPARLPVPARGRGSWWGYGGPLAVVYTGLAGGDLILPVRLPSGGGQFRRLAHYLADPAVWHKIDLVRVRDRRAPGGWRYQAHLMILGAGWVGPSTLAHRAGVPQDRWGGVDGNVSNIAIASLPATAANPDADADTNADADADAGADPVLLCSYLTITPAQAAATQRHRREARGRMRALDRSRRATNTGQYQPGSRQRARADRRATAGLPAKTVDVPRGPRLANAAGIPTRAYRKDTLSHRYRTVRADHAAAASATTRRQDAYARQAAQAIVAAHGPHLVTEDVDIRTWAYRWGRALAAFTPGRLLAALAGECRTNAGRLLRAATATTALSQHCTCGTRARKTLSQRRHTCPCGVQGDRDIVSAALASAVILGDPDDPRTAAIDHLLRQRLHTTVLAGRVQYVPLIGGTAQQDGPVRSTIHHNPTPPVPGTGGDGSRPMSAPAGQGERPAQPRHRPHHRGRRRTGRTSHTPPFHKPPGL